MIAGLQFCQRCTARLPIRGRTGKQFPVTSASQTQHPSSMPLDVGNVLPCCAVPTAQRRSTVLLLLLLNVFRKTADVKHVDLLVVPAGDDEGRVGGESDGPDVPDVGCRSNAQSGSLPQRPLVVFTCTYRSRTAQAALSRYRTAIPVPRSSHWPVVVRWDCTCKLRSALWY